MAEYQIKNNRVASNPIFPVRISKKDKEAFREAAAKDNKSLGTWFKWLGRWRIEAQNKREAHGPTGTVEMPRALTAENGAKKLMIGEFSERFAVVCETCGGEDEFCPDCEGSGTMTYEVPVSWPTIKAIYAKAVDNFS